MTPCLLGRAALASSTSKGLEAGGCLQDHSRRTAGDRPVIVTCDTPMWVPTARLTANRTGPSHILPSRDDMDGDEPGWWHSQKLDNCAMGPSAMKSLKWVITLMNICCNMPHNK